MIHGSSDRVAGAERFDFSSVIAQLHQQRRRVAPHGGRLRAQAPTMPPPATLGGDRLGLGTHPPTMGPCTAALLVPLGYDAAEIEALRAGHGVA